MSWRGKGRKFTAWGGARARRPRHRDVETCSHSNMQPFNITMYTTGAHLVMIAVVGTREGSGGGGSGASTTQWTCAGPSSQGSPVRSSWEGVCPTGLLRLCCVASLYPSGGVGAG